uniref:Uncharacterized protein n=1 Tax=Scleropages formosus TaxID=113540 RepID=A0A8C9VWG0_SCLFO
HYMYVQVYSTQMQRNVSKRYDVIDIIININPALIINKIPALATPPIMLLLVAFLFCWFVTGNVWIFSVYPPNYDDTIPQEPYCDRNLYLFALWSTVAMYVLLGVLLLACICLSVCIWICGKKEPIRGFTWNV